MRPPLKLKKTGGLATISNDVVSMTFNTTTSQLVDWKYNDLPVIAYGKGPVSDNFRWHRERSALHQQALQHP